MSYLKIENLYRNKDIFIFNECYALEKIEGTSSHISFKDGDVRFFSGGSPYQTFINLFNKEDLLNKFKEHVRDKPVTIYGEAYGGKIQKMSKTYGDKLKFVAFDVKIDEMWLCVPAAESFCKTFGIEFVHYVKVPATIEALNAQRDADSVQSIRNGCGSNMREGIIIRPLIELTKTNGERIISKHKRPEFRETKTVREVTPEQLKILEDAEEIAEEFVTPMRLNHVLDKLPKDLTEKDTYTVIQAMLEDIRLECKGEFVETKESIKAISKRTAFLFRKL